MIWFICIYFIFAVVSNILTSYIIVRKISKECGNNRELFRKIMGTRFRESSNWLETSLPIPVVFHPIIKQIFFPFNIYALIKCYREAIVDVRG